MFRIRSTLQGHWAVGVGWFHEAVKNVLKTEMVVLVNNVTFNNDQTYEFI